MSIENMNIEQKIQKKQVDKKRFFSSLPFSMWKHSSYICFTDCWLLFIWVWLVVFA